MTKQQKESKYQDKLLERLRELFEDIEHSMDSVTDYTGYHFEEAFLLFNALDGWLCGGGLLPSDWRKERDGTLLSETCTEESKEVVTEPTRCTCEEQTESPLVCRFCMQQKLKSYLDDILDKEKTK